MVIMTEFHDANSQSGNVKSDVIKIENGMHKPRQSVCCYRRLLQYGLVFITGFIVGGASFGFYLYGYSSQTRVNKTFSTSTSESSEISTITTELPPLCTIRTPTFSAAQIESRVQDSDIDEASGIAASRNHPGILYTHNDKGGKNRIYAMDSKTGQTSAVLTIENIDNFDWEDVAVGPCSNTTCIYIAETGDHSGDGAKNIIYRVQEPSEIKTQNLYVDSELQFKWNQSNCETVMVSPNEDVYVVSKVNGGLGTVCKLSHTAWGIGQRVIPEECTVLMQSSTKIDPVGGDISPDGTEMLIKYKKHIYYWNVTSGNYIDAISSSPTEVPYTKEKRGEAVCWDSNGSGYYTTGEGTGLPIYYYARSSCV